MEFQENGTLMGGRQMFIAKETSSKIMLGVYMYRIYTVQNRWSHCPLTVA